MKLNRYASSHTRSYAQRLACLVAMLVLGIFGALLPITARAATIPVDTPHSGVVTDGNCSLSEAIIAANTNTPMDACPAGDDTPVDTIVLGPSITYTLPTTFTLGTGLPPITSTIVISGNASTIARESAERFRLLAVEIPGDLTLHDVTLFNGATITNGGAILNYGTLAIFNSEVISNAALQIAGGSGGGIYNNGGTITLTNAALQRNQAFGSGGGLANVNQGIATLNSTQVAQNTTAIFNDTYTSMSSGGGIYNGDSTLVVINSAILSNTTSVAGGGIASQGISATLHLVDSDVRDNEAQISYPVDDAYGGGFAIISGTAVISSAQIQFNQAQFGGGISARQATLTIVDSEISTNYAPFIGWSGSLTGRGGGVYSEASATLISGSQIFSNLAERVGGGVYNVEGTLLISNSHILTNTSYALSTGKGSGAGVFNAAPGEATIANSHIIANNGGWGGGGLDNHSTMTVTQSYIIANNGRFGGGINNVDGILRVLDSEVRANAYDKAAIESGAFGGGIYNEGAMWIENVLIAENGNEATYGGGIDMGEYATATISNTQILNNRAESGGGIGALNDLSPIGSVNITNTDIISNVAADGAGIYMWNGDFNIYRTRILDNISEGNDSFASILLRGGSLHIKQSCIVGNSDTALNNQGGDDPIEASGNWWGTADGPSGAGPGSGDSISTGVVFAPFLTNPILGCPPFTSNYEMRLQTPTLASVMPGQPISHTIFITNTGADDINNLTLTTIDFDGTSQVQTFDLLVAQVYSHVVTATVTPALNADGVVTFTATVSHALAAAQSDSASYATVVPRLTWSASSYNVVEEIGHFTATALLTPPNPYVTVTAQARMTDTPAANFITTSLTFPPNSNSQPVGIVVEEDNTVPRQIQLAFQNPVGAALGTPRNATLNVDAGAGVELAVSVSTVTQQAVVGQTILYSYRITNTGEITLTVTNAIDNRAGVIPRLVGIIPPNGIRTGLGSYKVLPTDESPLVNEIVVTAEDAQGNRAFRSATTSVLLVDEFVLTFPFIRLRD